MMEYNMDEIFFFFFSVRVVEQQFDKTWSDVLTWYTTFNPAFFF